MRALVVGGSGFLGRRVVARLADQGHDVASLDVAQVEGAAMSFVGDVRRLGELGHVLDEWAPETIIQLAYALGPESATAPYQALTVNVHGMDNVFEAARVAGVRRVVYASSVTVHGPQRAFGEQPVTEASPVFPHTPYGLMKSFNEDVAHLFAARYDIEMVGVRLSNLFGCGRRTGSSGPWADAIVSSPARGLPVRLPVSPDLRTSLLYVEDAAEFVARLVTLAQPPAPVYLTGGYAVSIAELVTAVRSELDGAEIGWDDETAAPGDDIPVYRVDNGLIRAHTGYDLPPLRQRIVEHASEARTTVSAP